MIEKFNATSRDTIVHQIIPVSVFVEFAHCDLTGAMRNFRIQQVIGVLDLLWKWSRSGFFPPLLASFVRV